MKKVFLASRFGEFNEIRKRLRDELLNVGIAAIDLNDNMAVAHPPLERSLQNVRQSDILILLIGDTYGTIPAGESKSYTHLEYEEARKNNKPVYVFGIGQLYRNDEINYSQSEKMKEWQKELEGKYTLCKFGDDENINTIVHNMVMNIYKEENKVWIDEETGLMWQVKVEDHEELGRYKWQDIYKYKDKLNKENYGGHSDWRVPTIGELETLNTEESYPNIYASDEETFIKKPLWYSMTMKYGRFWSSTSKDKYHAYGINFNRKRENSQSKNGNKEKDKTRYVRCVRLWSYDEIEDEWNKVNISLNVETLESFLQKYSDSSSEYINKAIKQLKELDEKEKETFNSLSPMQQKLFKLQQKDNNTPKITLLFNSIDKGEFDTEKTEAIKTLIKLMKEENKWKEVSSKKNPLKDKEYQRTLKVIEWLNECE